MPGKFPYLINKKITVNGKQIFCKVTGEAGSEKDGQPYILVITGGPGFSHELTERYVEQVIPIAAQEQRKLPHFIFYDHLGCGESDKATDPEQEYTLNYFTDLAAHLVENVQDLLKLKEIQLYVEGGSFGSLIAMKFPERKPEWLAPDSAIKLKQITSKVGPNGAEAEKYAFDFLQAYYANHPNYADMLAAEKKLFSGTIKDKADYVQNFVIPMAPVYAKDIDKSFLNRALKRFVSYFPNATLRGLDWTNRFLTKLGLPINGIHFADIMLGKCSIDVLNHFFKTDFDNFNLIESIKQHNTLYQKIPICLIYAGKDHMVDEQIAHTIQQLLPDTSATIIFDEPHMLSAGASKNIYAKLNYDLFVTGYIHPADVDYPAIKSHTISAAFNQFLSIAHHPEAIQTRSETSTTTVLRAMPEPLYENNLAENNTKDVANSQKAPLISKTDEPTMTPTLNFKPGF